MAILPWINYSERVVARNHPTLTDVTNRPLRTFLQELGLDPDVDVASQVVNPARLGSGTPDGTTFLRGDSSWATPSGGSLGALSDVDLTGVQDQDGIIYDQGSGLWLPGTVGGGSAAHGLILVAAANVTNAATIDVASGIDNTYDEYQIHFVLVPATDNVTLYLRVSTDGGATWVATGTPYGYWGTRAREGAGSIQDNWWASTGANQIAIGVNHGNNTTEQVQGIIFTRTLRTNRQKMFRALVDSINDDGGVAMNMTAGRYNSATAVNGIRLLFSSGNIASGWMRIYGVSKTAPAGGGGGGGGSTPLWVTSHPDTPPSSPNAMDDEFDDTTGMSGPVNGLNGRWAWRNQGGATIGYASACGILTAPSNSGDSLRIIEQSVPVGNWRVRAKASFAGVINNYSAVGLVVFDSASSKLLTWNVVWSDSALFQLARWNSVTSFSANIGTGALSTPIGGMHQPVYFELEYNGTSIIARYSYSGIDGTFLTFGTEAVATFLGSAPETVGIYANRATASSSAIGVFRWFRRVA